MRAPAGGTLEDRLRDGPLAPAQAVSVVARLADALAALTPDPGRVRRGLILERHRPHLCVSNFQFSS